MKVNLVFKKTYLFLCVCMGAFACVYIYVPCVCSACGDEKLASDSLEPELTWLRVAVGAGTKPMSPPRAVSAPSLSATSSLVTYTLNMIQYFMFLLSCQSLL